MKRAMVIYHTYADKPCADGFTSAWVASKYLPEGTLFHGAAYGDAPPDVTDMDVYIVDFSYPREVLLKMHEQANRLVVLDHHKTAKDDLESLGFCQFDMNKSGAMMTWEYFQATKSSTFFADQGVSTPDVVQYVQDRDLWKFDLFKSKEVNAYIATLPTSFEAWDSLHFNMAVNFEHIEDNGGTALRMIDRYVEQSKGRAYAVSFGGHIVPMVNTTFAVSELVGELAAGQPFAIGWWQGNDGLYEYSLRARDGNFDVGALAREQEYNGHKGGGHVRAAGFKLDYLIGSDAC